MFAVIFEVEPKPERWNEYLDLAKGLAPRLQAIDGFLDIDRLESARTKGRLLSLSTWRNEKAVVRWRTQAHHHAAQEKARREIFRDYRLRVGEVTMDSQAGEGGPLPQQRLDETEIGSAKLVTVTDVRCEARDGLPVPLDHLAAELGLRTDAAGLLACDVFASIYHPGKLVLLASWRDADAAKAWTPLASPGVQMVRHRHVRIIRDYGMFERREAPQFYPEAERRPEQEAAE
jgi:heme-degrading monooxygenase HmoA